MWTAKQKMWSTIGSVQKNNCRDHPKTEYVGKSTLSFQSRYSQHRDYVKRDMNDKPSGEHFNLTPGHTASDMKGLVLEHCKSSDPYILKDREHHFIDLFNSYRAGLIKTRWEPKPFDVP